tara:strand:- start:33057 stop:34631 length:1575 start_codon:yes stop_codon:yes gene_type:complete
MPSVTVPKQFYIDERVRLYPDWQADFWREFGQNSRDARASVIDFRVEPAETGCVCTVEDNGCGMSREVLEDVYFALGKTTKTGEGNVGGFGRARILTCFSHKSYRINTGTLQVDGDGGNYDIIEADYQRGCKVTVEVDDASREQMLAKLKEYLAYCQFGDITVRVNGFSFTDWLYKRNKIRDLSFASVHVNKSGRQHRVVFRVNGQYMFSRYTDAAAQVVVEIHSDKSREVLSATRGGLMGKYQEELDKFLAELSVDTRSALRPRVDNSRLVRSDGGWLASVRKTKQAPVEADAAQGREKVAQTPRENVTTTTDDRATVLGGAAAFSGGKTQMLQERPEWGVPVDERPRFIAPNLFNVYIKDETGDPKMKRVIDQYDPKNWVHTEQVLKGQTRHYRKGAEHLKLLMAWKLCCEEAINVLMERRGYDNIVWTAGWLFSPYAEAMHTVVDGTAHALLLNPVTGDGRKRYTLKRETVLELLALAAHEVAHVTVPLHNEEYANLLTDIQRRLDQNSVWRRVRTEVKGL